MMSRTMDTLSEQRCHGGVQGFYRHHSRETGTPMRFAVYLPPAAREGPVPVLYFLAGLTCTEETATIKAGAQAHASRLGLALVMPDTSPRGASIEGEDDDWDFGTGAGFYLNATRAPWSAHYRMHAWVTGELRALVASRFPVRDDATGVTGHSMGGHGALTIALKAPDAWRTVSAFAPICAPTQCPWGEKAFSGYLGVAGGVAGGVAEGVAGEVAEGVAREASGAAAGGVAGAGARGGDPGEGSSDAAGGGRAGVPAGDGRAIWAGYDATALVRSGRRCSPILVDQGEDDQFLEAQLHPHLLEEACIAAGQPLELRRHPGYDHSYWFIQTFIADHLEHHARGLTD